MWDYQQEIKNMGEVILKIWNDSIHNVDCTRGRRGGYRIAWL